MDIVYTRGEVTAAEVQKQLSEAPSYSAVRALLRILVEKGFLKIRVDGPRYVYQPTEPRKKASHSALTKVLETFFNGSLANAVSSLVDHQDAKITPEELLHLKSIIAQADKNRMQKKL